MDEISINKKQNQTKILHENFRQETNEIRHVLYENNFDTAKVRELTECHTKNVESKIQLIDNINKIKNDADWIFKTALENAIKEFNTLARSIWKEMADQIMQKAAILKSNIGYDFLSEKQLNLIIDKAKIISINSNEISDLDIKQAINESENLLFSFINYILPVNLGMLKIKEDVIAKIRNSMYKTLLISQANIKNKFNKAFDEFLFHIEKEINESLSCHKYSIGELIRNQNNIEEENFSDANKIHSLSENRAKISALNFL